MLAAQVGLAELVDKFADRLIAGGCVAGDVTVCIDEDGGRRPFRIDLIGEFPFLLQQEPDVRAFGKFVGVLGNATAANVNEAKAAGELYATTFYRAFGLETVSLRYFNVFGPRQDPLNQYAGVIAAFASRMLRGKPPIIFGDGTQSRDFTYVDNVIQANLLAAEAPQVHGEVVNIGCGERTDLNAMAGLFNAILGTDYEPVYEPPRPGDVMHSLADISVAATLLGYEPAVGFRDGLARTVDWYRWALETGYGGWAGR